MKKAKHREQDSNAAPPEQALQEQQITETGKAVEPPKETVAAGAESVPKEAEKIDPMLERLMRLQADFENFRKRVARERTEFIQCATENLVSDLLPVLDHFDLALAGAKEHGASPDFVQGIELIYDELIGVLAKHGLSIFRGEQGQPFDPQSHEAVAHVPSEEVPADTVIRTTRKGYRLGPKLLRPAQVIVSSGPPAADN